MYFTENTLRVFWVHFLVVDACAKKKKLNILYSFNDVTHMLVNKNELEKHCKHKK